MIRLHKNKMSRAAAGSRSRPSRIATPNAATPRAGILIPEAQGPFKPETADQNLSLGGSRGPFSFAKENGPFDSHPCAAQGYPRCTCAANSQLLYNLLTLFPFHFQMTCGILKIANCIGVSFLKHIFIINPAAGKNCLLYTSPSPRDTR